MANSPRVQVVTWLQRSLAVIVPCCGAQRVASRGHDTRRMRAYRVQSRRLPFLVGRSRDRTAGVSIASAPFLATVAPALLSSGITESFRASLRPPMWIGDFFDRKHLLVLAEPCVCTIIPSSLWSSGLLRGDCDETPMDCRYGSSGTVCGRLCDGAGNYADDCA